MGYDVKLTGTVAGDTGSLLVEQWKDGAPYRQYMYHYDTFAMPTITGMPPINAQATVLRSVAWVRQAMMELGLTDTDAAPEVTAFSGLTFTQVVSFDQFLSWMTAQLLALEVAIARTQGLDWAKLNIAWQKAGTKV